MEANNEDFLFQQQKENQRWEVLKFYGVLLVILSITVYLLRRSKRLHTIILFYFFYRFTSEDNNFYLCLKKENKIVPQCIHSSQLNTTRIIPHPNFSFNIPINKEILESKFNNINKNNNNNNNKYDKCNDIIFYKRRNSAGLNKLVPLFKNQCNIKLEISDTDNIYIVPTSQTTKDKEILYLTKPVIDGVDTDGYYLFLILFQIFYDEVINEIGKPNRNLKKAIISYFIFFLFFSIISVFFIAIKSKFDLTNPNPTESELLDFYNYKNSK
ncbi:hypothetical protein DICPUDRAFT_84699 [Dictyostelium purpureum]|uniref:Uncharacterized protein n=1 Tax=Dictyostelium purpureum TaxID=5786 RepID=F1A3G7_DICPU|nr:uncharacterized protein DICPUDRAFT_84699 [Dictyostelium purpureum]EGC29263.1 hypothetical protein DICPUDRAFT_84699 [Dictyostelium purpureum]|eukprot:XP_003294216.1 hypothetical protein DICPUDRAFT_84699 [Dictyostelium purpureum]